jgi:hypothetical protein
VLVVILIAALAVIAAVVFAFRGRGGEMSVERTDYVPLDLGPVSATDVALLRPPTALWGYSVQATDEAMEQIAESIRERDVRIVALEQLVTDLGRDAAPMAPLGSPYAGARHRRDPGGGIGDTQSLRWEGTQPSWQAPEQSWEAQEPSWQGQQAQEPWQELAQEQPWQDREVAWQPEHAQQDQEHQWQEQEQEQPWQPGQEQQYQSPEPPWQAAEPPRGDSQPPPPERSHD